MWSATSASWLPAWMADVSGYPPKQCVRAARKERAQPSKQSPKKASVAVGVRRCKLRSHGTACTIQRRQTPATRIPRVGAALGVHSGHSHAASAGRAAGWPLGLERRRKPAVGGWMLGHLGAPRHCEQSSELEDMARRLAQTHPCKSFASAWMRWVEQSLDPPDRRGAAAVGPRHRPLDLPPRITKVIA